MIEFSSSLKLESGQGNSSPNVSNRHHRYGQNFNIINQKVKLLWYYEKNQKGIFMLSDRKGFKWIARVKLLHLLKRSNSYENCESLVEIGEIEGQIEKLMAREDLSPSAPEIGEDILVSCRYMRELLSDGDYTLVAKRYHRMLKESVYPMYRDFVMGYALETEENSSLRDRLKGIIKRNNNALLDQKECGLSNSKEQAPQPSVAVEQRLMWLQSDSAARLSEAMLDYKDKYGENSFYFSVCSHAEVILTSFVGCSKEKQRDGMADLEHICDKIRFKIYEKTEASSEADWDEFKVQAKKVERLLDMDL